MASYALALADRDEFGVYRLGLRNGVWGANGANARGSTHRTGDELAS